MAAFGIHMYVWSYNTSKYRQTKRENTLLVVNEHHAVYRARVVVNVSAFAIFIIMPEATSPQPPIDKTITLV